MHRLGSIRSVGYVNQAPRSSVFYRIHFMQMNTLLRKTYFSWLFNLPLNSGGCPVRFEKIVRLQIIV